jgi:hypothetical protein
MEYNVTSLEKSPAFVKATGEALTRLVNATPPNVDEVNGVFRTVTYAVYVAAGYFVSSETIKLIGGINSVAVSVALSVESMPADVLSQFLKRCHDEMNFLQFQLLERWPDDCAELVTLDVPPRLSEEDFLAAFDAAFVNVSTDMMEIDDMGHSASCSCSTIVF